MKERIQAFYYKEKLIALIAIVIGIAFGALYFSVGSGAQQYAYFFYTVSGFGLLFIFQFGYQWLFLRRQEKIALNLNDKSVGTLKSTELNWLALQEQQLNKKKKIFEILCFIGVGLFIVGLTGFMKAVLGGSGLGLMLGSACWFAFSLFSDFHLKEYIHFLEK